MCNVLSHTTAHAKHVVQSKQKVHMHFVALLPSKQPLF